MVTHRDRMLVVAVLFGLVLAGCSGSDDTPREVDEAALSGTTDTSAPALTPTVPPFTSTLEPDLAATRRDAQPNELGVVPVLQYHLFTTDRAAVDDLTRHVDDFRADLQWLYDHGFHVIPMADLVRNAIAAPVGKRPVVLTFDDASPGQFRLLEQPDGSLLIDPSSAVGVMERFFTDHPDFGRGGFFALLNFNCFANPAEPEQMPYCHRKLEWLATNGYEIGNHTLGHEDLRDVTDESFREQIGEAWAWIDANVPAEGALPSVLAMPYGNYPDRDLHQPQRDMMREGFEWAGATFRLEGALMVGAEPAPSPASANWDHIWIPRIQAFDEPLGHWFPTFENGDVIPYVSDGDPDTISVPDPLPGWLDGSLDPARVAASGRTLVPYDPATGETTSGPAPG